MFKFSPPFWPFPAMLLPLWSQFSRKERDRGPGEGGRTMFQQPFPSFVALMTLSLSFFFCKIGMAMFTLLWGLIEGAHMKQPIQSWKCNNHTLEAILRSYFFPSPPLPPFYLSSPSLHSLPHSLLIIYWKMWFNHFSLAKYYAWHWGKNGALMGNKSLSSSAYHLMKDKHWSE